MNIFISAGDLSGDICAADLIKEIKKINPSCIIHSIGGQNLKEVSDIFMADIVNIGAFGFIPIKQIIILKKILAQIKKHFLSNKPSKIILVDYFGFHIHLARLAKKLNIDVYYYVSPQVWASRASRIQKLKEVIKKMFVIFPFEEKLYRDQGIDAHFVGNPLIDKVQLKENFDISTPPTIGLFPGSRADTIKRHMPIIIETSKILKEQLNASFILFSCGKNIDFTLPDFIKLETKKDMDIRKSITIALCPSGTVSLENALMGIPMTVMYKLSNFNYFLIKSIIKVKYITIANILADKAIVPEFIQFDAKPQKIAQSIIEQLNPAIYNKKVKELLQIRQLLGAGRAATKTAEMILNS
jgi:lipid-A-disaccharide synthase